MQHKVADQEDVFGQWSLGTMYRDGRGVTQDEATSLQYFAKAAETFLNMDGRGMYSKYWYGFMLENETIYCNWPPQDFRISRLDPGRPSSLTSS